MALGRPISLTPNVASKTLNVIATAGQTEFTPDGGYRVNQIGVYRNGIRLAEGRDFTATDGVLVTLLSAATVDDLIEFEIFDSFNIADAVGKNGDQTMSGKLTAGGGFNIGIASAGLLINSGGAGISSMNFVGTGNTFQYNSDTNTVDISIAGGGGGGGIGTAINYDDTTASPFTYIDKYGFVTADLDLGADNAGVSTSYVVSVVPDITVLSGVAVTVGTGKTMVIDALKIGDL